MIDCVLIKSDNPYFEDLVKGVSAIERDYGFRVLCAALFSSIPMGIDNITSDLDAFILVDDLRKDTRVVPNGQIYYNDSFVCIAKLNEGDIVFEDHFINNEEMFFDACINDIKTVDEVVLHTNMMRYPTYHDLSVEEHMKESKKSFVGQKRSSGIFISRMLVYRHIWDKEGYFANNWESIKEKHLKTLNILDMWYTTSRVHLDVTLKKPQIQLRKYINMLNSLFMMQWIIVNNSLPPIKFTELLDYCTDSKIKNFGFELYEKQKSQIIIKNKVKIENNNRYFIEYYNEELEKVRRFMEDLQRKNPKLLLEVSY